MKPFLVAIALLVFMPCVSFTQANSRQTAMPLPDAILGINYQATIPISVDPRAQVNLSVDPSDLPPGMAFTGNGEISGIPREVRESPFIIAIRPIYADGKSHDREFFLSLKVILPEVKFGVAPDKKPVNVTRVNIPPPGQDQQNADGEDSSNELINSLIAVLKKQGVTKEGKIRALRALADSHSTSNQLLLAIQDMFADNDDDVKVAAGNAWDKIMDRQGRIENKTASLSGKIIDSEGNTVSGVSVQLRDSSGQVKSERWSNDNGQYTFDKIPQGTYEVRATQEGFDPGTNPDVKITSPNDETSDFALKIARPGRTGQENHMFVGWEQSGATASNGQQNFFFDGYFSTPFPFLYRKFSDESFGPRLRVWGNVRISSAPNPQLSEQDLTRFVAGFTQNAAAVKVKDVVRTFEATSGLEFRLTRGSHVYRSTENGVKNRFSLSLIAGGGIVAPINPVDSIGTNIFEVTPEAVARYPEAEGKTYIAFAAKDRDRFYRQYFGGVRFKTFYLNSGEKPLDRPPATLDVTFGQNEAITGGRLRGGVFKLEGFFPLPIPSVGSIYLFGAAQMKLSRSNFSNPLILRQVSGIDLPRNDTAIISLSPLNRDYYRIGVAIDGIRFIKDLYNLAKGNTNAR